MNAENLLQSKLLESGNNNLLQSCKLSNTQTHYNLTHILILSISIQS